MARALRRLGVSLSLVLIAAGVARADVSLLWTVPPTFTPTTSTSLTNDFSAQLAYTLSGGTYAPLALHFELPAGMQLLTTTQPATFTSDCANLVVGPRTCNFTAASIAVPGTGVSGAITISLRATRFQFPNGTVVPFEATATGAFTPTSGTAQAIAATASATSTAVANAVNVFHEIGNDGHTYVQGWGVGPDGLTTGYYYTLNIRPRNNGNAPYDADATITVTLPPALVYVGAYSSTNNAATPTSTVNDLVIDDEPLVGDAGGEVIARLPRAQSSASTNNDHFYWPHLHVEVFIPCGPIPVGLNNVDYAVDVLVTSIETDATGAHVAETLSATIANPPGVTTGGGACGEGFLLDKRATVNTRGTGRSAPYELRVTPPKGVVPLEDVLIVDPLPVGHGGVTVTTTNAPNLAVYTCVLPGVTTFDKDTFLTDYKDDECALGTARGPSATHVVGWDATWGDGDEDLGLSYLTVNVAIPYDYLVDGYPNPMVNTFTFSARGTFDGEPVTLAGSDDAAINIIDGSRPSTSNISNASWTTTPPVLSPGESGMATFNPTLNGNYSPLLNPWVDLTFPDYVTIDDVAAVSVGSGCSGLTSTVTTTPTGVRVAWTDGTGTYYYPSNCMYVRVRFTLDAGAPYLNDDTFDFGAITRAENEDPAVTPTGVVRRFTAAVPPEIRTNAVATCAPGDGAPLFTVTTTNSGGTPLTNVVSTLFLPAVGDGASTEGAVFVAVEDAPVDATIRTFDGATWSAYPPAVPSAVERVEVTIPALAATDVSTFVVRTQAPGAAAVLYPRSTASADGLGAADSGLGVPFEFAECPATVTVVKYWDAAGTGFQDPGAPLLPGWHFIVTDADGLTVLEGDTGADGTVAFSLHQGTYGIAETLPAPGAAVWTATGAGATRTVSVGPAEQATLAFGNTCACVDPDPDDCLVPACQPDGSCVDVAVTAGTTCDDGDACTVGERCDAGGGCVGGAARVCDDGNGCTIDGCDPGTGCTTVDDDGAACSDGSECTVGDACAGGSCVPGAPRVCDDANACTDDACDDTLGCVTTDNDDPCEDGDLCTVGDRCGGGACVPGGARDCDDHNVCTDDGCNPTTGCTTTDNEADCDDGSLCTVGDVCAGGSCVPGAGALDCDDENVCTDDSCDAVAGCQHVDNDDPCSDGDFCTNGDVCAAGACVPGPALACDDANDCTDDRCESGSGCVFAANTAACSDGSACTVGDACADEACVPGPALDCDDDDECTVDSCDAGDGCHHAPDPALATAWLFTEDDGDVIVAVSATPDAPAGLANGAYLRWRVTFIPADAGDPLASLPTVGASVAAADALPGASCGARASEPVTVYEPLPCDPGAENAFDLGAAEGLNALVCGDYDGLRDAEGAIAVAHDLTPFQGFAIGEKAASEAGGTIVALYLGGTLTASSGQIWGDVAHALAADAALHVAADVNLAAGGSWVQATPLDFASACADARLLSLYLGDAVPTAPTAAAWYGTVLLVGDEPGTNVFAVDAADLVGNVTLDVRVPAGATAVVNVLGGPEIAFGQGEIRLSGADAAHVLVNFPGATDLTIGAFQFNASLLAPFATLHYSHGDLHGTVVVARLDGDVELRADGIFGGTIAVVTGCEGEPPAEDTSGR